MHERRKLQEAQYFLAHMQEQMQEEHDHRVDFGFELSAFLGAARSVLQYAHKEAASKRGGPRWYAQAMKADSLLTFFKKERDTSIHEAPVVPATRWNTHVREHLRMEDDTIMPLRHVTTTVTYRFNRWPGDESVVELSERYLKSLQALVDSGVEKGIIRG